MRVAVDDGDGIATLLPAAPPPPAVAAAPPPAYVAPAPAAAAPAASTQAATVNGNGETLEQAKAAIRAEVAAGVVPGVALANHPLPQGSVTTTQALDFLASLPQSTAPGAVADASTVTGPPIDTLPGYDPTTHAVLPIVANAPADPGVDLSGDGGGDRSLESAYRPPGVVAQWRNLVDVFKIKVPKSHAQITSANKAILGVFK